MNKQTRNVQSVTFHRFDRKGWSVFRSLGRQVRIGVLSAATLTVASAAMAEEGSTALKTTDEKIAEPQVEAVQDELDMAEVTVSGTLAPLTQLQSARIVSVLSRQDIEQAGAQCVNDLLKLASGVDVRQRGGFGVQTDISIDGGTYEQITILLNGVNISNPHTGHLAFDLPVSISDIERIEVLQGAASRVYGGQAFGGAINIVTRRDDKDSYEAGAEAGSWGTVQADGRASFIRRNIRSVVSGGGGRSDGGTFNDAWKMGKLYYNGGFDHSKFSLDWQFGLSRKDYGANTFYSGSSIDQWEQNERYLVSIAAETKGIVHLHPEVYWNRTYDNYQWHKGTPNNSHQADVYGLRLSGWTQWKLGKTAFGAELRNEGILSSKLGHAMDTINFTWAHGAEKQYTHRDNRTLASFNLEHNVVLDRWTISAGVVANMTTSVSSRMRFYPGVDISYRPATGTKLFLSYNKGFRLPSFTDLFYDSPDITGNDQLRPEENRSLSLGARYQWKGISLMARGFYNRGHNMIDYVKPKFGDKARADNFDLDAVGAQAEISLNFTQLTKQDIYLKNFTVGYTYLHQDRDGKYALFTSLYADDYLRHKLTASLHHKIYDRLSATWAVRYQQRMGSYQVYDGLKATDQLCGYTPYATLDLKLQWTDSHYEIYVKGTNLTDRRYCDLGNIPQPGVCVMGGARVKF